MDGWLDTWMNWLYGWMDGQPRKIKLLVPKGGGMKLTPTFISYFIWWISASCAYLCATSNPTLGNFQSVMINNIDYEYYITITQWFSTLAMECYRALIYHLLKQVKHAFKTLSPPFGKGFENIFFNIQWVNTLPKGISWLFRESTQIGFMCPSWGPPGSCRPQVGPMLALWTLLSGQARCK